MSKREADFLWRGEQGRMGNNGGDRASYITYLWYAGVEVGSAGGEQGAAERWKCLYKVNEDV